MTGGAETALDVLATLDVLTGARIRRIDMPDPALVALTLALESLGPRVLLLSFRARSPGLGFVPDRPTGAPAGSTCRLLRKHLENAVITQALVRGVGAPTRLELTTRRGPERMTLQLEAPDRLVLGTPRPFIFPAPRREPDAVHTLVAPSRDGLEALEEAGQRLMGVRDGRADSDQLVRIARLVRDLRKRLIRRRAAVEADRSRIDEVPALRTRASLVLASLAQIPRGSALWICLDTTVDPPVPVEIALDPARSIREQADAWFDRARRLERGAAISAARLAEVDHQIATLRELEERVDAEGPSAELEAALVAMRPERAQRRGTPQADVAPRLPYRSVRGTGDREIRVGRGAKDNDALTLHHARAHDLWLHARGVPGAHVVVPLARGEVCPPELLLDAAHLAAHFSDQRDERVVEVDYVARGKVRKRKGSPAGRVELDHPKTIAVRIEPARLTRLLRPLGLAG